MRAALLAVVLASPACGRIGFDAQTTDGSTDDDAGGDAPLPAGTLVSMRFEDSFDEQVTSMAATCIGGCPGFSTGRAGSRAVHFTGTQCLEFPDRVPLHVPSITVTAWVQLDTASSATIVGKQGSANDDHSWEMWTEGTPRLAFSEVDTVSSKTLFCVQNLILGSWHHLAAISDGAFMHVFLDGTLCNTRTSDPLAYGAFPINVGCIREFGTEVAFLQGSIDELAVYDHALTGPEIAALAQ